MPLDAKICQDIKVQKCAPLNELNIYTDTLLENAIAPFIALKSSYKNLSDNFGKTRTLKKSSNQEILKDLLNKMTSIENQFPILKGKTLKPFLNAEALSGNIPTTQKYQAVIKTQLLENRAHLSKKLNENIDMNNCLLYGEDSHCKKFKDHFERIPPSQSVSFFDKDNSANKSIRLKNYAASEIYSNNQCLDNFRGLKNEFNSFATDFSINFGLTLFSGGTSLLLKAGGQGVKLAMAAQKAMLLTDAAFLAHGVDEAIVTCSKELNILESISQPKPKPKSKDEKSNQLNICPTSLATPEHTVVANYQGCITGAMMASLNALPFVPTVVLKYLSRVKVQKNNLETTSSLGSLLKFKTPKKNFDPHDLKSAGSILPAGKTQDPKAIFNRDGVYVYIIDDKGNMVLSHRTPNLNAGTKEGDQFLATHRGLFNTLSEKSSDISIIAAGEIRVIGGVPVRVSPRAGSFHSTPEEVLANMRQTLSTEEKLMIDNLLKEYGSFSKADRSNSLMVEMHMEDFLDLNPKTKVIFEKMQKQMNDLTDKRLASAKEAMESRDLIPSKIDTKFVREVSGDAHIEGRAAAIAEIDCHKSKSCAEQIEMYHNVAKKFMEKFKGPEQCESAVVAKLVIKDLKGLSQKERAFQFYSQRSYLLFKEGPIEFIKNGKPSSFGITEQEAIKYLDEWSRGF